MEDTDRRALYSIFCYVLFPFFSWFYIMYELKEMYLLSTMYISENFFKLIFRCDNLHIFRVWNLVLSKFLLLFSCFLLYGYNVLVSLIVFYSMSKGKTTKMNIVVN